MMTIWTPKLAEGQPLYLAIADAIADDIAAGTLKPGQKLPPQRELAWQLKVTLGTVTRAYKEAEIRGLLAGEVGRGSFVRERSSTAPHQQLSAAVSGVTDLSQSVPPPVYSCSEFDAALEHVMRQPSRLDLLDYMQPEGHPLHRAMGAKWLARSGIKVSEADVIVTAGAHMGLIACLSTLLEPGEAFLAENLNYPSLKPTARSLGLTVIPLDMDAGGLMPDSLERAARLGEAKCLYIVPTLQNPTTSTLTRQRRETIVDIARRYNLIILEDDIFRLLDFRVQPPTLYELAPERTYHITSLSKTLAPGLRIGFVATPQGRAELFRLQQRVASGRAIGLTAEVARYWMETDIAGHLLRRIIAELALRRAIFDDIFQGVSHRCEPGSPYAWVPLPAHWSAGRFTHALRTGNIKVTPGSAFSLGGRAQDRAVRICFGHAQSRDELRNAFAEIRRLISEVPVDDFAPVA
jgi:DNA-binding transcriptional MocR family regulator